MFLGSYSATEAERLVKMISKELGPAADSWVHVVEQYSPHQHNEKRYSVALNIRLISDNIAMDEENKRYITSVQQRMLERHGIQVRQFIERSSKNERRLQNQGNPTGNEQRISERRSATSTILVFEALFERHAPPTIFSPRQSHTLDSRETSLDTIQFSNEPIKRTNNHEI